jgi:Complex I intermediate-associated protein 30 (CIA30)
MARTTTTTTATASVDASETTATTTTIILLEDFSNPTHEWTSLNDPVMGGQSFSNVEIANGVAHFTGKCAIVPSLKAPGFITMVTGGIMPWNKASHFADVSSCDALQLELKSNTPYEGYRLSFGKAHPVGNHFAFGYKTPLVNVPYQEFGTLTLPFSSFSSKWDDATGEITVTCQENEQYCPSSKWLKDMQTMSFWGEGVEGDVDLEIKTIKAVGCTTTVQAARTSSSSSRSSSAYHMFAVSVLAVAGAVGLVRNKRRGRRNIQTASYQEIKEVDQRINEDATANIIEL